ncbi:SPW repeat domain-containing protein [Haloprofundus salinisoli]|uniref:SPW repeat domain-containing protein n=1 Tax=Haloprofundus salinisoli TaxID=2876193 RepID=UPI003CE525C3
MESPTKWTVAVTAVLGLWLFVAPSVLGAPVVSQWNNVVVGSVILVISGYNYSREQRREMLDRRAAAVNGLLGGWLLVAPFVFGVPGLFLWNNVIVGIGVTSLALYNIYAAPRVRRVNTQTYPEDA